MISIKDLQLEFPGRLRLKIDTLEIERGTIFSLIGSNGAGKSTLLNILSLFQKPDKGHIEVFSRDISRLKNTLAYRRSISFVLSRPYLLQDTVFNNINLPLRLRGIRDRNRVHEVMNLFAISHLSAHPARSLSQGETHRVSLARALVTQPELLLLDEAFSSLDPEYKTVLLQDLRRIIKLNTITTVVVTQDQNEALFLADVIGVIKGGKVLQTGSPQEVFTRPISKEVADFVGMETIVAGTVVKKENSLCFVKVNSAIIEVVSECKPQDRVVVCIRPESVILSTHSEDDSARNHFQAIIKMVVPWGLEYKIDLDCGFNLVAYVSRQSVEHLRLQVGQEVFVAFKATAVHLIKR